MYKELVYGSQNVIIGMFPKDKLSDDIILIEKSGKTEEGYRSISPEQGILCFRCKMIRLT